MTSSTERKNDLKFLLCAVICVLALVGGSIGCSRLAEYFWSREAGLFTGIFSIPVLTVIIGTTITAIARLQGRTDMPWLPTRMGS